MANKVEATYLCPVHGMFTMVMDLPAQHLDCPTCQQPSPLKGASTVLTGTAAEVQELVEAIKAIFERKHPVPTRQSRGGQFYSYDPTNPVVRTEPQVLQDSLTIHESAQRAKMRAILDQLD